MLRSSSTRAIVGMGGLLARIGRAKTRPAPGSSRRPATGAIVADLRKIVADEAFGRGLMEPKMAQPLPGTMPDRLPEGARPPADFDPVALAKMLLRVTRAG